MTTSPIPDAAVEAFLRAEYTAHLVADTGLPADDSVIRRRVDERIARCREFPGLWEQTRAGLAAVYPLLRQRWEAELTASGRLLPPGGDVDTRYAVQLAHTGGWERGYAYVDAYCDLANAREMAEYLATAARPARVRREITWTDSENVPDDRQRAEARDDQEDQ